MGAVWVPELSLGTQSFLRAAYGLSLLLLLLITLPSARRFFVSERWGGYAKSSPFVDLVQNPYALPVVLGAWLACAALLIAGRYTVAAAFVNLVLAWYFFVFMRWRGVLRGMGAPGFMTYWLAACVFLLEYGLHHDPTGRVREATLLTFRLDFAVIMLCAGTYKCLAGYGRNDGMELGLVNPWWGYWGRFYRRLPTGSWAFKLLNHLAWGTEIVAGLLMLFPATAALGAILVAVSFAFILTQIRLGFLCEMVILAALLFVPAGHGVDRVLSTLAGAPGGGGVPAPWALNGALVAALVGYAALLPLAKVGQYYNLLAKRSWPPRVQSILDAYANVFGIIIWRVFSADHTNFFARISFQDRTGRRRPAARFGALADGGRFNHVGEFICLVSLFTTRKYYAGDRALFVERLLRYSRTLPCPRDSDLVFEHVSIQKDTGRFREVVVAEYTVDPRRGRVDERVVDPAISVHAAGRASPLTGAARPGTYAPGPVSASRQMDDPKVRLGL